MQFSREQCVDTFKPSINNILDFLTMLVDKGLSYSSINVACAALSSGVSLVENVSIFQHKLVKRFLKGVFHMKPRFSSCKYTWNVSTVLKFLKTWSPIENLSLLQLSCKLATLLALLSGQRGQTIHLIDIRNIDFRNGVVVIRFGDLLKSSSDKRHLGEITLEGYTLDSDMCIINILKEFIRRTVDLRGTETKLFIQTQKPHKFVSRDTISRWIKHTLCSAGIDTSIFTPHSTRAASTSAAFSRVPLDTILKTAGWESQCTFRKFYNKPALDTQFSKYINSVISDV